MTLPEQLVTGFGIGRTPHAPGTAASFAAIVIAIPVMWLTHWYGIAVLAILATGVGIWLSEEYSKHTGNADPKDCVIDEFAGQWIACMVMGWAGAPDGVASAGARLFLAFVLFRLFDIAKPGPVKRAESLPGGIGIMADDVLAGLMAGFVVFLFAYSGFI